ncbi:hypothetical protein Cgig2_027531 [Carnegiea gigantea]|uniref:Uncharacterized protein n=1 Tax=Carnegiea gigantea TaxID=171969 RepID=A0A9Q1JN42_9CARY|nr:hypothetical protein Cgig2_027531 [Carnegiea gigantea]
MLIYGHLYSKCLDPPLREGAYFSANGNSYTTCASTLHSGENGGFDCLFESDEGSDNSTSEGRLAEQNSESSSEGLNVRRARGRESNKCNSTQKKGGNIDMSTSKANKKRVPSFEDLDMSGKEGEEDEAAESSCGEDILWRQFFRPNKRRGESSKAKRSRKYYISSCRSITDEEKRRAHDNAISHMKCRRPSGVPMFAVTMSQTNVCIGFHLACSL